MDCLSIKRFQGFDELDGAVTVQTFSDERRFRPDMEALLSKVRLTQSETIPGQLEKMWVEVSLTLNNGQSLTSRCDGPKGFWGLPERLVKH